MSTILKALRKLEEDNAQRGPRALREEVMAKEGRGTPRGRWLVFAALLAVVVAGAIGLAVALVPGGAPAPPPAAPEPPAVAARPPAHLPLPPLPESPPAPRPRAPLVSERALPSDPRVQVAPRAPRPPLAAQHIEPAARPIEASEPVIPPAVAAAPEPEPVLEVPAEPVTALAAAVPLREAASALESPPTAASAPAPAPTLAPTLAPTPAATPRRAAPAFVVVRTQWHPTPDRRVAVVELAADGRQVSLYEGDGLGPLVVREITLSGVVFDHGDVELMRRVGEPASAQ